MLNADRAPYFETCPRCGDGGLQTFVTHSYCVGCNYSNAYDDEFLAIPQWAIDAIKAADREVRRNKKTSVLEFTKEIVNAPKPNLVPELKKNGTEYEAS